MNGRTKVSNERRFPQSGERVHSRQHTQRVTFPIATANQDHLLLRQPTLPSGTFTMGARGGSLRPARTPTSAERCAKILGFAFASCLEENATDSL